MFRLSIWSQYYNGLSPEEVVERFIENGIYCSELSDEHGLELLERDADFVKTGEKFGQFAKDRGFEIYQVSVDPDEFKWRQSAKNLPWITVYNSSVDGTDNLIRYNVTNLPTAFIINRNGEIAERVNDITKLESTLNKYM